MLCLEKRNIGFELLGIYAVSQTLGYEFGPLLKCGALNASYYATVHVGDAGNKVAGRFEVVAVVE